MNKTFNLDMDLVHKLFIDGVAFDVIARETGFKREYIKTRIRSARKAEPDKWPKRVRRPEVEGVSGQIEKPPIEATFPNKPAIHHEASPVSEWRMSQEEIDRLYGPYKPPTTSYGTIVKKPVIITDMPARLAERRQRANAKS